MKRFAILLMLIVSHAISQNRDWINFSYGEQAFDLVSKGDELWIATSGGLVKLDKTSGRITFFTKGSAMLPDTRLRAVAVDSSGNVWVGSQAHGVGRYDGTTCRVFNSSNSGLPFDQYANEIAVDSAGVLWFGTEKFLSRYDGATWRSFITAFHGYFSTINDIVFDKNGMLWIATDWGLAKFTGDTVLQKFGGFANQITSLFVDRENVLWMGEYGLVRFDGTTTTRYNTGNSSIPTNQILDIAVDLRGNLWFATDVGLVKFNRSTWQIFSAEPPTSSFYRLTVDVDSVVWIASLSNGLYRFDGNHWSNFRLSNSGLLSNTVRYFATDTRGNRWIVTNGLPFDRLIRFDGTTWEYYDPTQFESLDKEFRRVYSDSVRQIWEGFGVIVTRDNSISESTKWRVYHNELHKGGVIKVDGRGVIWEATSQGLRKYDGGAWTLFNTNNSSLPTNNIARIAFDYRDSLWITTLPSTASEKGELLKFSGAQWNTSFVTETGGQWIAGLQFDAFGNIWAGILSRNTVGIDYGGGVKRFNGSVWMSYTHANSPLPSNSVVDLCLDRNQDLWIGTYGGGLAKFDRNNVWTLYNADNSGLPDNNVEAIEIDGLDNKWLGVQSCGLTVFREGGPILTDIEDESRGSIASNMELSQNFPNPFNPQTTIKFELVSASVVSLEIFNILGIRVRTLVRDAMICKGTHSVSWDGREDSGTVAPSGVYFCQLRAGELRISRKMILLR